MTLFGIQWAPLNTPMRRRLQTLAVAAWFGILVFGPVFGYSIAAYVIWCTSYWWLAILYIIYIHQDEAHINGNRWTRWGRNWAWWRYFRDYFPHSLVKTAELDPARNYLFCIYPHGVLSTGAFTAFCTNALNVDKVFPRHKFHMLSLRQHFFSPLSREVGLALGALSAEEAAISKTLSDPKGGRVAALVVGGAAEALMSRHDAYHILLKKRKGFCRLALQQGAPLVPVFSFGENRVYSQVESTENSLLHRFQEKMRKVLGMAPVIIRGRGLFQYTFGLLPHRSPVTVVVGKPLEVEKVPNPAKEQIEELHARFTVALRELYDQNQREYHNGEDIPLSIE